MKIKLSRKLTLACSLCLTVVVIIFTVTRASGLEWQGRLDVLWEVYFQIVAAEVGLILVAMTAFRAMFVSRTARNQHSSQEHLSFWMKSKNALRSLLGPRRWISSNSKDVSSDQKHDTTKGGFDGKLPSIPGATMSGIYTFIDHQGELARSEIECSLYPTCTEENQDTSLFSKHASISRSHLNKTSHDEPEPERFRHAGSSQHVCPHCSQAISNDIHENGGNFALSYA